MINMKKPNKKKDKKIKFLSHYIIELYFKKQVI